MSLTALLFDVDGTLADTERDGHRPAFNRAFAEAGLDWEWSVPLYGALLAITGGKERIRYFIDHYAPQLPPGTALMPLIAQLHQRKTHFYTQALAQGGIPLRPGIRRLLQSARADGLRLGIATTTTPENVTALLDAEMQDCFEVIAAGDVVPAKKPAPDIYNYLLAKLSLTPDACLAIEDSIHGLRAAQAAGIKVVLVTINDYTKDQYFTDATLILNHLGEPDMPCQRRGGLADMQPPWVDSAVLRHLHAQAFHL